VGFWVPDHHIKLTGSLHIPEAHSLAVVQAIPLVFLVKIDT
jgi:hypothetical protein